MVEFGKFNNKLIHGIFLIIKPIRKVVDNWK